MNNVRIVFPCPICKDYILNGQRRILTEDGWVHQECLDERL